MAMTHGKGGKVTWDGNKTAHVTAWSVDITANTADSSAMDNADDVSNIWKSALAGFKDWNGSIEICVDSSDIMIGTDPVLGELGTSAALELMVSDVFVLAGTGILTECNVVVDANDTVRATYTVLGSTAAGISFT